MTARIIDVEKEPLFNLTPFEISIVDSLTIRTYLPDLFAFNVHVSNFYWHIIQDAETTDISVPTLQTFKNFALGVLQGYTHIQLRHIYLRCGQRTDSVSKIKNLVFGEIDAPRFLIELCREICRPIVTGNTVYVPVPIPEHKSSSDKLPWMGMGAAQAKAIYGMLRHLPFFKDEKNWKVIQEEGVLSALMTVADGEYSFVDQATATWRKEAWYNLMHFRNGTIVPAKDPAVIAGIPWTPHRRQPTDDPIYQDDVAVPVQFEYGNDLSNNELVKLYQAILRNQDFERPDGTFRVWLYFDNKRENTYNEWFRDQKSLGGQLPRIERRLARIRVMLAYINREPRNPRFPSEENPSRTPPHSTVRSDALPRKPKAKKRGKKPNPTSKETIPSMVKEN